MSTNEKEITKEQIFKAMQCKTAKELMAFAKDEGIELSMEEAEAYLSELEDFELDGEHLKTVAGGGQLNCWGLGSCPKEGPQTLQSAK